MKDQKNSQYNLCAGFLQSAARFAHRPALDVNNEIFTYSQLAARAAILKAQIHRSKRRGPPLVALLAYRSPAAFSGILGILASGCGYVPLHPEFPKERNLKVLELSGSDVLIVGPECAPAFKDLLKIISKPLTFVLVDMIAAEFAKDFPQHIFLTAGLTPAGDMELQIDAIGKDEIAYLLFTSGSTGEPKGVPVSHHNASSYVAFVTKRYSIDQNDRFSQMHDITFDNSIHDIFVAWATGACLCVPTKADRLLPVSFIQKKEITMWFSVPSVAGMIDKYGRLEPGIFPSLRYSFFAGEALYHSLAEKWQKATPNGKLINTYGPTETTVTITYYDWDSVKSPTQCRNGVVPLGKVYDGNQGRVMKEDGTEARMDEPGELCLSGSQVTKEYWNNPQQTKRHYVHFPDTGDTLWYRSGDLTCRGADGCLYYLGRIDNQVKIQGNRVELGAIDEVLRQATGVDFAVSIPQLISAGNAASIVAFVSGVTDRDERAILEFCRHKLPPYMVPAKVRFVEQLPMNRNGKVDRLQLQRLLEAPNA